MSTRADPARFDVVCLGEVLLEVATREPFGGGCPPSSASPVMC